MSWWTYLLIFIGLAFAYDLLVLEPRRHVYQGILYASDSEWCKGQKPRMGCKWEDAEGYCTHLDISFDGVRQPCVMGPCGQCEPEESVEDWEEA